VKVVKSERGITLVALTVYMIAISLVMGVLALISTNYKMNYDYVTERGKYISEFNKFNMFFIADCKNNKNTYSVTDSEVVFEDGTRYTFSKSDSGIYRNEVKICNRITHCEFKKMTTNINNCTKNIISVSIQLGGEQAFATTTEYVLKYW